MRRALALIQTPTFGGPHNQVLRLHQPLRRRGWEIEALLPDEAGNGAERLGRAGIPVFRAPMCRLRRTLQPQAQMAQWRHAFNGVDAVRRVIAERAPDVVVVCGLMTIQGAFAAHGQGVPIVWQLLSTFAPKPLRVALAPFVRSWAHSVMSTGNETARQHPGIGAGRAIPFFPPVQVEQWRPDSGRRAAARARLGIPADAVLVGTVGNRNRQKGHERLVEVAARLRDSDPQTRFCVFGACTPGQTDYYEREVIARARRLGLIDSGILQFVDAGEDVATLIHAVDVFVLTSRAEGVPTALLEAMTAGIPAVAMNVGSIGEAIRDGRTGFIVPADDLDAVTHRVRALVRDGDLRSSMGAAAAAHAHTEFSSERCADRHVDAFSQALQRAKHRE